ncbi:hypothetical protein EDB83DRAFT_1986635 [Lactarius deliciosus]|nr:hypothetical protein EDB83DRAFT_1986635 [Lactarius deliciosus]
MNPPRVLMLNVTSSRNLPGSGPIITESETSIDDIMNTDNRSRTLSVDRAGVGESSSINQVSDISNTSVAHDRSGEPDELSHTRDSDDLYSQLSLASFSFGAPAAHDIDTDSTISVQALGESGAQSSSSVHQGDSGGRSETRRFRAEMLAIGNGRRRHSLPANWYTTVRSAFYAESHIPCQRFGSRVHNSADQATMRPSGVCSPNTLALSQQTIWSSLHSRA